MNDKVTLAQHLASKPRGYANDLAKRLHTNKVYLSQLRIGTRMPGTSMVIAIEKAEGISLDLAAMRDTYLANLKARAKLKRASKQ